jgi:hypothetical protein
MQVLEVYSRVKEKIRVELRYDECSGSYYVHLSTDGFSNGFSEWNNEANAMNRFDFLVRNIRIENASSL